MTWFLAELSRFENPGELQMPELTSAFPAYYVRRRHAQLVAYLKSDAVLADLANAFAVGDIDIEAGERILALCNFVAQRTPRDAKWRNALISVYKTALNWQPASPLKGRYPAVAGLGMLAADDLKSVFADFLRTEDPVIQRGGILGMFRIGTDSALLELSRFARERVDDKIFSASLSYWLKRQPPAVRERFLELLSFGGQDAADEKSPAETLRGDGESTPPP